MALDKSIKSGREWRKPYRDSTSFDRTCRNGRGCKVCRDARMHGINRSKAKANYREDDN